MKTNIIYFDDCLNGMKDIPDKSINMILCDLPYGTTACSWDIVIPFDKLWEQYKRIIKDNAAIVLFGSQPFTTDLINSNREWFKYEWIWDKVQPTGQLTAKYMPMKLHENICIFGKKIKYIPQMEKREKKNIRINAVKNKNNQTNKISQKHIGGVNNKYSKNYNPFLVNPKTILTFSKQPDRKGNKHPTQKPEKLFSYLVKTYTNENDIVLDNCMGSGTTAISCLKTNRKYIGYEMNKEYYDIACKRIKNYTDQLRMF